MSEEIKASLQGTIKTEDVLKDFMPSYDQIKQDNSLLAEIPPFPLINYLYASKFNGYLVLQSKEIVFDVFFQWGTITSILIRGKTLEDGVAEMLIKIALLSLDGYSSAKKSAEQTGKSVLQVIYEMGLVPPKNLMTAVKQFKEDKLKELLSVTEGIYSLYENARFSGIPDPIRIETNIFLINYMKEKTEHTFFKELEPLVQFLYGRYPIKTAAYDHMSQFIMDSQKEQRALNDIIDGSRTLKELFALSILSRHRTARLFYILTVMNLLEYKTIPIPKGSLEEYEQELKQVLERTRAEDMFLRMNLHWTTHPDDITPAYLKMVDRYASDSSIRKLSPGITKIAEEIFQLITEAYNLLSDPVKRYKYREDLIGTTKLDFGVEFLMKQAHLAYFRGDAALARKLVESAIDCRQKEEFYEALKKFKVE